MPRKNASDRLTIGKLAALTGVTAETVRYYERIGLLASPARTAGNYRIYGDDQVRRLGFVRRARELGFPIEAIRILLTLADQPERPCAEVDVIVRTRREDVDRKIGDLERLRDELDRLALTCRGGKVAECRIIEALSPDASSVGAAGRAGRAGSQSSDRRTPSRSMTPRQRRAR